MPMRTPIKPAYTDQELINKYSAELVEELLETAEKNTGVPWFHIVTRKMKALVKAVKRK